MRGKEPLGWDVIHWWFEIKDEMCLFDPVLVCDPDQFSDLPLFSVPQCFAFQEYGYRMRIACDQYPNACLRCLAVVMPCLSFRGTLASLTPAISWGKHIEVLVNTI
jgi:hypothetical protein